MNVYSGFFQTDCTTHASNEAWCHHLSYSVVYTIGSWIAYGHNQSRRLEIGDNIIRKLSGIPLELEFDRCCNTNMFSLFANVRNSLKQAAPVLLSSYGPAKRLLSIVNRASSACQPRVWNLRLQSGARRATYYAVEQPYISPIMGRTTRSAGSQAAEQKNINRILVFGTIGICYYGYNLERVPFTGMPLTFLCWNHALGRIHFVDVSPRAEVRLGDDEFRHYASTHNVMKVKDLSVFGVNDAGVRLIVRNRLHTIRPLDHLDRPIEFYIVDNPEPNAFALPGGRIVIHSGLFKIVGDDENKLAAVLAHELGHVIGRHGGMYSHILVQWTLLDMCIIVVHVRLSCVL